MSGRLLVPLLAAAALLAGCEVGPDFLRAAAPETKGYTPEPLAPTAAAKIKGGEAQRFITDSDLPGEWWTLFHSPPLNSLITQALAANPNLQAAQAALRQAQENVYAQRGTLFPTVTGSAALTREKISGAGFGIPGLSSIFTLGTASVNVSYAVDVFGGVRRQLESVEAQRDAQRFQLEATYLTLTSNVVVAAVQEAGVRAQITATEDIIKYESEQLTVLRHQFDLGGAAKAAVLAQAATLAQTRATLPPLQKQLAQTRDLLATLAGRFPSDEPSERFDLAALTLPAELPVGVPAKLVEQRPDIRAAEAQLHAAGAQIGVATANQLPQLNLTGSFGSTAAPPGGLFAPGSGVWSLGGSLAQTIFDAGTLVHRKRAAVAAYDQAAAQYRGIVLSAFQNVADALRALQSDANALNAQVAAERAARDSLELSRQQFQLGATTYLSLLTAEQTFQQARISLVQAQANRYADTAALFQALGGGWWNRDDVAKGKDRSRESDPWWDQLMAPIPTGTGD
jgi:NodT family efflux transporter outer membrane factor (OMF) lipoprotein